MGNFRSEVAFSFVSREDVLEDECHAVRNNQQVTTPSP